MPLQPGDRVGAYEILSTLGAGGMGVVYRARDAKLGREVAIKTLPDAFAADSERRARFEREARALAALSHPNVASIFGFEQAGSAHLLVMELVEGDTLADWIARGPIDLERALPLFLQIAAGLEAAHTKGIVHRDLKPANIKIAGSTSAREIKPGAVKILDFGLAKALAPETPAQAVGASHSPTLTLQATMRGELLGTAGYMSPEQAQGEPADQRADIWAFGVCLLEALTGRRVFGGSNASLILASVLKDEPDLAALPASTPAPLRRLLRRCLEKDRDKRLHDIADARLDLEEAIASPAGAVEPLGRDGRRRPRLLVAVVALGLLVLGGVVGGLLVSRRLRPVAQAAPLARFVVSEPAEVVGTNPGSDLAIAGDGSAVAYLAQTPSRFELRLRRLDQLGSAAIVSMDGPASVPFFSPDDRWVGYWDVIGRAMRKVSTLGGPSVRICDAEPAEANWGPDDTIVFGQLSGPLRRVAASGGEPRDLTTLADGEIWHRYPAFLPGGRAVLFAVLTRGQATGAIFVYSLETGERKLLVDGGTRPRYAPSGHLIYNTGSTLFAVAFDPRRLEIIGDPVPVLDDIATSAGGAAKYDVSANGTLVYVTDGQAQGQRGVLVWVDREGREEPIGVPPQNYVYPRLSPDGTRIAVDVREAEEDLWVWDLERGRMERRSFAPGTDFGAVWSPDGSTLFYASREDSVRSDIFRLPSDGTGGPARLTDQSNSLMVTSITPTGDRLIGIGGAHSSDATELVQIDASGRAELQRLLHGDFRAGGSPDLSRDGRWLAYGLNEAGTMQVFVRPFPALDSGLWQVSTAGGNRPLWSRDGKEIFFRDPGGRLMVAAVERQGSGLAFGPPEVVIETAYLSTHLGRSYDVSPDGRRFLMVKSVEPEEGAQGTARRIVLVQNWLDELLRVAPARAH